jgi:hypothetical protein
MKRKTPYNAHPKKFICKSGIIGYTCKLQANYHSFEDFEAYCRCYGIHERLGYKTVKGAWRSNPQICGSTIGTDFGSNREYA